jgi:hypothetical protein
MPVCRDKINPFLGTITAGGTIEISICIWIGLVNEANKIIFHSRFLFHIEMELTIHDL